MAHAIGWSSEQQSQGANSWTDETNFSVRESLDDRSHEESGEVNHWVECAGDDWRPGRLNPQIIQQIFKQESKGWFQGTRRKLENQKDDIE